MNPNNLNHLDELVKEYLLFRGFTQTNHTFSIEKKTDKLKGFQVEKMLEQINIYISNYDIVHVVELWNFLDITFFSKIDYNRNSYGNSGSINNISPFNQYQQQNGIQSISNYTSFKNNNDLPSTIKKLASSLKKYYVIYCLNNNKMDKVREFFDLYSLELIKDPEWQHWFALPYIKNPQFDPLFEVYFTKNWAESFSLSLKNFLTTIFKNIPLPKILQFNLERQNRKRLEAQVEYLLQQNEELKAQVDKLEYHNRRESMANGSGGGFTMGNLNSTTSILKKESSLSSFQHVNSSESNLNSSNEMNSFSRVSKRFEPRSNSNANIIGIVDNDNDNDKPVVIGIGRSRKSATSNSISSGSSNINSTSVSSSSSSSTLTSTINQNQNNISNNNNSNTTSSASSSTTATTTTTTTAATNSITSGLFQLTSSTLESSYEMSEIDETGFKSNNNNGQNGEMIYMVDSQEVLTSHSSAVTRCKYLSNGSKVASSSMDGTVRLCSVDGFSRHTTIYCLSEVISLEWESKSKLLLCGTTDAKIKLWNTQTDKAIGDINTSSEFPRVEDIVCNPNGNSFATSSTNSSKSDSIVYTWNLRTLKTEERVSSVGGAFINSLSFNNTGSLLSTGCADGIVRIFDIKSGSTIAGWQAHTDEILSVQFCSDDNKLYSLGKDGKIYQWNIHTMAKPIKEYEYPGFIQDKTTKISFNSDQSSFIVGSNHKYAYIYNVDQSSPVLTLSGHSGPVVCADWHPSQNIVVTGSLDQTIRLTKLTKSINNL